MVKEFIYRVSKNLNDLTLVKHGIFFLILLGFFFTAAIPAFAEIPQKKTDNAAEIQITFSGDIDFVHKKINVVVNPRQQFPITLKMAQTSETTYQVNLNLDHLMTPFFELTTVLETSIERTQMAAEDFPAFKGEIKSQNTLINYKPMQEVLGKFVIKNKKLYIDSFFIENLFCQGNIDLSSPYRMDLLVKIFSVDMENFIYFFAGKRKIETQGEVSGQIRVTGVPLNPKLEGTLSSFDGRVNKLKYSNIVVNVEGYYPNIHVADSYVTKTDGLTFTVEGGLDLSERPTLAQQIKSLKRSPLVESDGMRHEWTFRRILSQGDSQTTEIKYLLKEEDSINNLSNKTSDMIGVETKMEF